MPPTPLEEQVLSIMSSRGLTLATAESCSGGLIAHRLTNVPGSTAYFLGGVVSYANSVKESVLGVSADTLTTHGAVSEPVAREMVEGARTRLNSDVAAACTGIAGPSGGSPEKPVGLVFIAVTGVKGTRVERNEFHGNRESIKQQTSERVLTMILEYLE